MISFFTSYLETNLLFIVLFILLAIIAAFLEIKHVKGKIFTTKKITYLAAFIAVSAILNIVTGYLTSLVAGSKYSLTLGQVVIMIPGMLFGPLSGIICGLCSDTLGSMSEGFKSYHFGFTFETMVVGFIGGMIWLFANKKNWAFFTIIFYFISLALSEFIITPICLVSSLPQFFNYKMVYSWAFMMGVTISTSIKLIVYLSFFFLLFQVSYQMCTKSFNNLWCNRNIKEIHFLKFPKLSKLSTKNSLSN